MVKAVALKVSLQDTCLFKIVFNDVFPPCGVPDVFQISKSSRVDQNLIRRIQDTSSYLSSTSQMVRIIVGSYGQSPATGNTEAVKYSDDGPKTGAKHPNLEDIASFLEHQENVVGEDPAKQLYSTEYFCEILCIENPPIQQVIESGVVHRFVQFLDIDNNSALQYEAGWALACITSGTSDHIRCVIEAGAVPVFIRLLMSPYEDVRAQAAWALGNVACDSVQCRDLVLSLNALSALLTAFQERSSVQKSFFRPFVCSSSSMSFNEDSRQLMICNATWMLANLCQGKPPPQFEVVQRALPLLARLLLSEDLEIVADACWGLSYISDSPNDRIQAVLDAGVAPRLVELLGSTTTSVQTPALRTVGNIVMGDHSQKQLIIDLNALPVLVWMLDNPKKSIRGEACWTISNITAGTADQMQAVIDVNAFPKLFELLQSSEFAIQKDIAWAVANATSGGTPKQILYLVHQGVITLFRDWFVKVSSGCAPLSTSDSQVITLALEGLNTILRVAQSANMLDHVVDTFSDCRSLSAIKELQNQENTNIYVPAIKVLAACIITEEQLESRSESEPEIELDVGFGGVGSTKKAAAAAAAKNSSSGSGVSGHTPKTGAKKKDSTTDRASKNASESLFRKLFRLSLPAAGDPEEDEEETDTSGEKKEGDIDCCPPALPTSTITTTGTTTIACTTAATEDTDLENIPDSVRAEGEKDRETAVSRNVTPLTSTGRFWRCRC